MKTNPTNSIYRPQPTSTMHSLRKPFRKITAILKDYCLNSSLAGVKYIADDRMIQMTSTLLRYHPGERLFWLICVLASSFGSYYLISEYHYEFESGAMSIVDEGLDRSMTSINLPSVAICEIGYSRQLYPKLTEIVDNLIGNSSSEEQNDIEEFLIRLIFQNQYSAGSLSPYCSICDDCVQCPTKDYQKYADMVRLSCKDLFVSCIWNDKEFDCCKYFLPMKTTEGGCFMINSIQKTTRDSDNWLPMKVDAALPKLKLKIRNAFSAFVINKEDIPHIIPMAWEFSLQEPGSHDFISLRLQHMHNDVEVRTISPDYRRCIFPWEKHFDGPFKLYSYSVCVAECQRDAQIRYCNCTHHNLHYESDDSSLSCDYEGLLCLDSNGLIHPESTILQPWRTEGLVCRCLPSCTEDEIDVVEKTSSIHPKETHRSITIGVQSLPTQHYRRQVVQDGVNMVVTLGGILGLFMGASILSAVELVYFFTIRIIGSFYLKRSKARQRREQTAQGRKGLSNQPRWHPNEHLTRNKRSLKSRLLSTNQLHRR